MNQIYLFIYVYQSNYPYPIFLYYLPACLSFYLSAYMLYPSAYLSIYLPLYICLLYRPVYLSSLSISIYLSIYLSIFLLGRMVNIAGILTLFFSFINLLFLHNVKTNNKTYNMKKVQNKDGSLIIIIKLGWHRVS